MAAPVEFSVHGPFDIPLEAGHRSIDPQDAREIWNHPPLQTLASATGCYMFGLRRGGGTTPVYVGKTRRAFSQECFAVRNRELLFRRLRNEPGTLVLFLVEYQKRRGRPNRAVLDHLENQLIDLARNKNPNLWNIQGPARQNFVVRGVLNSGAGAPSLAARALKRTLGL